ncbi:MAG: MBL fold metallo-hydrolase [Tabrizicola sp.]|uniref:MBL fold metallo-hydrolase n=1 Tax=Tabrizicola sp. TaxID=2005166 RepID=UPI00273669A0|nr:MBL fold metallo-hydrolase [Tabrizicola sp.]MDP3264238.1 MBL fold metallo-hydrolase [Tabrizicola sp.]MDP3649320.1 MBL fold metallo-hydrolase [Paracoccaceae bacterium]MDZ4067119.1 MBL fold metallo-hydrolase [Tabrizicola sp.]
MHLRILTPHPGILAFYDGRVPGYRFAERDNWVDDGALSLGIASYALILGDEALVYDTGTTLAHGHAIRTHLESIGIRHLRVILSHWHRDHIAGTEAFADTEIIASAQTAAHLVAQRANLESDTRWPPIRPLVAPTTTYKGHLTLALGPTRVALIHVNIHSDDATVLWLPDARILLAGDTVEDTVTYVAEPDHLATHLTDLARLKALFPRHILPCHGDPDVIASGGYGPGLIEATLRYVTHLTSRTDTPLQDLLAADLAAGNLTWFAPYLEIHRLNLARVRADAR